MKKFIKKHIRFIIGAVFGAIAGFLYWKFIGCLSGNCAITSNPINATLYGALLGGLLFSMFDKKKKTTEPFSR